MEPAQEQKPVQSAVYTIKDGQIELARLQQQLTRLEERFDKYFCRLDELEESCQRIQKEFESAEQMIKEEHEFLHEQLTNRKTEKEAAPQCVRRSIRIERKKILRPIKEEKTDMA